MIPFYIKNFSDPSEAILRTEAELGIITDLVIGNVFSPKEASLFLADTFWDTSTAVMLIKQDTLGYNLGVPATPIASYLNIPIIVTNSFDSSVDTILSNLGTDFIYLIGDISIPTNYTVQSFSNVEEIHQELMNVHEYVFDEPIGYITLANPLDVIKPAILDSVEYSFSGTIGSSAFLASQLIGMLTKGGAGSHSFTIPQDYKYVQLVISIENNNPEYASELGDEIVFLLQSPEGLNYLYDGTMGGIPERNNKGDIIKDQIQFETTIYNKPGEYTIQVFGNNVIY